MTLTRKPYKLIARQSPVISLEEVKVCLAVGEVTKTTVLTKGQTTANCIPFITFETTSTADVLPRSKFARAYFSAGDLILERDGVGSGDCVLCATITIIEYDPTKVKVQQGTTFGAPDFPAIPSPVVIDNSFVYMSYTTSTRSPMNYSQNMATARIFNTTTVEIAVTPVGSENIASTAWFVAEALGGYFTVQHGEIVVGASDIVATDIIASVDMDKSFVIASMTTEIASDEATDGIGSCELQDATTVRFNRTAGAGLVDPSGGACSIQYQVITFNASSRANVQRGHKTLAANVSNTTSELITAVNTSVSMAHNVMLNGINQISMNDPVQIGNIHTRLNIDSGTVLRFTQTTGIPSSPTSSIDWEVIEWLE